MNIFYYKIIENGEITGLMTASLWCEPSETQVEITEEEYLQLEEQFDQENS